MAIRFRNIALPLVLLAMAGCVTTDNTPQAVVATEQNEAAQRAVDQGKAVLNRGDFDGALSLFQRGLRQDPQNRHAKLGLAESYLGLGAYEEALRGFRELGEDPELGIDALQGKGIALLLMGNIEKAHDALSEVVAERPDMWRAWNSLGRYYDAHQNWSEAENAYRNAIAAAPDKSKSVVLNNWGVSVMAQSRYTEAAEHFSDAIDKDRDLAVAMANLRLALAFQGRYAEAMSGVGRDQRARMLNNLGFVAMTRGDLARAEAYFLRALEGSPRFYEVASKNLQFLASMKQITASGE